MGDGAEEIRPHLLLFVLRPQTLLLLGLCGQRAGYDGDHQKRQERQRIAGYGKVYHPIGICKDEIDTDHTQQGGNQTEEIARGEAGDHQHSQHENGGGETITAVCHAQEDAHLHGTEQDAHRDQEIPPAKGEQSGNETFFNRQSRNSFPTSGVGYIISDDVLNCR